MCQSFKCQPRKDILNALFIIYPATRDFGGISLQQNYFVPFQNSQSPFLLSDDYKEYSIKSLERIRGEVSTGCHYFSLSLSPSWCNLWLRGREKVTASILVVLPSSLGNFQMFGQHGQLCSPCLRRCTVSDWLSSLVLHSVCVSTLSNAFS